MQVKGQSPPNEGHHYPAEPLTPAEVSALMRACSQRAPTGIRNRALLVVMYRGGLRIAEALALKASDIDAGKGTIRVLRGKGCKPRTAAIDDGAIAVIQRWADTRRRLAIPGGNLFCTLRGAPMSDHYVRDLMKRLARRAGVDKRVHPHGLRHTYAFELAAEKVPVNVISKLLGHSNSATTARYIDHLGSADAIAVGRARPAWEE
jgi:site-specific recombinase XerD